jgi:hypothetical protein
MPAYPIVEADMAELDNPNWIWCRHRVIQRERQPAECIEV